MTGADFRRADFMRMVIGGAGQGKMEYAIRTFHLEESDFIDGGTCRKEELFQAAAVNHFHLLVRRLMQDGSLAYGGEGSGLRMADFAQEIFRRNPSIIIVSDEIGCGIIPLDPQERDWREADGRICTALAELSERVDRVICGIGMRLK